jgi:hypothetical protein
MWKKKPAIGRHLSTHVEKETRYRSSPEYACGKRNPLYPIRATSICFNNIVSNLCNNSAVEKTNGMTFNPTATLKRPPSSPEYECGKINALYPIRAASFVSIILYLIHVSFFFMFVQTIFPQKLY